MAYIITVDYLENGRNVGISGPFDYTDFFDYTDSVSKIQSLGQEFQLLDDNGNVCFQGFYMKHKERSTQLEPLESFGEPYAQCSHIRFRNPDTGAWEPAKEF